MPQPRNDRISVAMLDELLTLDPSSGHMYWKARPSESFATKAAHSRFVSRVGSRADIGRYSLNGYARVRFIHPVSRQKVDVSAHRIVFAMTHGRWPEMEVDHIDGCRTNNRPENLREISHYENMQAAVERRAACRHINAEAR